MMLTIYNLSSCGNSRLQRIPAIMHITELMIGSFASRTTEPETINICGVDHREADTFSLYDDDPPRKSSSVVEYIEEYLPTGRRTVPSVLQICRESRSVAQQVYTRMALSTYDATHQEIYVNTLYDKFFIGGLHGKSWKSYMILVDLFIKLHSSRPLRRQIQRDVEKLQNIRFLTVEFNIFATAPARLWAEFPKLEQIVIAIFPYATISDFEPRSSRHHTRFKSIRPQRGTMYGKRAAWLVEHAEKALNKVKADDVPQWNIPRIEVVMRKTGEEIDDEIVEEWTDDPVEYSDEDDDDSTWYAQAEAKMNRAITKKEISWLKQKHHLSKKVLYPDRHPGKDTGDWIEDSETEEGLAHRPYDYEQCDN